MGTQSETDEEAKNGDEACDREVVVPVGYAMWGRGGGKGESAGGVSSGSRWVDAWEFAKMDGKKKSGAYGMVASRAVRKGNLLRLQDLEGKRLLLAQSCQLLCVQTPWTIKDI